MKFLHKLLLLLYLLLNYFFINNSLVAESRRFPSYVAFSPSNDILATLLEELASAKKTVDVGTFFLTEDKLLDALCFISSRRMVKVRVWADERMGEPSYRPLMDRLMAHGVTVYAETLPNNGKLHLKCAVIDRETVITGSCNWTPNGLNENFENLVVVRSPLLAAKYTSTLEALTSKSKQLSTLIQETEKVKKFPELNELARGQRKDNEVPLPRGFQLPSQMEAYFSLNREGFDALLAKAKRAISRIDIAMYAITDPEMIEAFVTIAKERRIKVRLLTDSTMMNGKYLSITQRLADAGVEIYYLDKAQASQHLKTLIIDSRLVWTGSANWTTSAQEKNIEDMVLLESPELAAHHLQLFDVIQAASKNYKYVDQNRITPFSNEKNVEGSSTNQNDVAVGLPESKARTDFTQFNTFSEMPPLPLRGSLEYLDDEEYFPILLDLINTAHQSIYGVLYQFSTPGVQAIELPKVITALEEAAKRGVYIYLILDTPENRNSELAEAHSKMAELLRAKGVDVRLGLPAHFLHNKMLIADLSKILLGSHNWSEGALSGKRVHECSALMVLEEQLPKMITYIKSIPVIQDMRSRRNWDDEIATLRYFRSLTPNQQKEFLSKRTNSLPTTLSISTNTFDPLSKMYTNLFKIEPLKP